MGLRCLLQYGHGSHCFIQISAHSQSITGRQTILHTVLHEKSCGIACCHCHFFRTFSLICLGHIGNDCLRADNLCHVVQSRLKCYTFLQTLLTVRRLGYYTGMHAGFMCRKMLIRLFHHVLPLQVAEVSTLLRSVNTVITVQQHSGFFTQGISL